MAIGQFKRRDKLNAIVTKFGDELYEIDEIIYRSMKYLPEISDLPWDDTADDCVLLIDVVPIRPVRLHSCR